MKQEHDYLQAEGKEGDVYGLQGKAQKVFNYANEKDMILGFINEIRLIDPDIILGFDIQKFSLGYVVERA